MCIILALQSPVFKAMLFGNFQEAKTQDEEIEVPDVQPPAFHAMLSFVATGNTDAVTIKSIKRAVRMSASIKMSA